MTPVEYSGWENHFLVAPPGDFRVQQLLAVLCTLVANMFLKKGEKPVDMFNFAPWLKPPETTKEREAKDVEGLMLRARATAAAYQAKMAKA